MKLGHIYGQGDIQNLVFHTILSFGCNVSGSETSHCTHFSLIKNTHAHLNLNTKMPQNGTFLENKGGLFIRKVQISY